MFCSVQTWRPSSDRHKAQRGDKKYFFPLENFRIRRRKKTTLPASVGAMHARRNSPSAPVLCIRLNKRFLELNGSSMKSISWYLLQVQIIMFLLISYGSKINRRNLIFLAAINYELLMLYDAVNISNLHYISCHKNVFKNKNSVFYVFRFNLTNSLFVTFYLIVI